MSQGTSLRPSLSRIDPNDQDLDKMIVSLSSSNADIRTTMNIYGDAATEDMRRANSKVVQMVLRTGTKG